MYSELLEKVNQVHTMIGAVKDKESETRQCKCVLAVVPAILSPTKVPSKKDAFIPQPM